DRADKSCKIQTSNPRKKEEKEIITGEEIRG
ncbi:hypothetical protein CFC21_004529, partial [Triticum aestivum]